jgi:hypothetical protein
MAALFAKDRHIGMTAALLISQEHWFAKTEIAIVAKAAVLVKP